MKITVQTTFHDFANQKSFPDESLKISDSDDFDDI